MKSIRNLANQPIGMPLLADDVLEFHAARLLLLFLVCGTADRIDGLTKMAKLDFLVRYPQFFEVLCERVGNKVRAATSSVESSMVRFHYGPWDHRYYHVLSYLEAKGLISTEKVNKTVRLRLTVEGKGVANALRRKDTFTEIVAQMAKVKHAFGKKAGSTLKNLIYEVFNDEVTNRSYGEVIK